MRSTDWSANEYGAKTGFPNVRSSPRRSSPLSVTDGLSARREHSSHLFKTQTCGRQRPPPQKSNHFHAHKSVLWGWLPGRGEEGRNSIAGRRDQYARYWAGIFLMFEYLYRKSMFFCTQSRQTPSTYTAPPSSSSPLKSR